MKLIVNRSDECNIFSLLCIMIRFYKMGISIHNILFPRKITADKPSFLSASTLPGRWNHIFLRAHDHGMRAGMRNLAQPFRTTSHYRRWTKTRLWARYQCQIYVCFLTRSRKPQFRKSSLFCCFLVRIFSAEYALIMLATVNHIFAFGITVQKSLDLLWGSFGVSF